MRKILAAILLLAALMCSLCACGGEKTTDVNVVLASFALDENDFLVLAGDETVLYYGMDPADIKACAAAVHMSGINCDEIILVEAKDAQAAKRVAQCLETRLQNKLNETQDYLPGEYAITKTCKVETNGRFVSLIVSPDAESLTKKYKASFH